MSKNKEEQEVASRSGRTRKDKKRGKKVRAVPKGLSTVTLNLVLKDASGAIDFYRRAFKAKELSRMPSPDGKAIWHAELRIGDAVLFVNDESPNGYPVAPTPERRPTCVVQLYVKNCDAWIARAVEAGASVLVPVSEMFWGDRMGVVVDPFNVAWTIATRTRRMSHKQMRAAQGEFVASLEFGAPPAEPPVEPAAAPPEDAPPLALAAGPAEPPPEIAAAKPA